MPGALFLPFHSGVSRARTGQFPLSCLPLHGLLPPPRAGLCSFYLFAETSSLSVSGGFVIAVKAFCQGCLEILEDNSVLSNLGAFQFKVSWFCDDE